MFKINVNVTMGCVLTKKRLEKGQKFSLFKPLAARVKDMVQSQESHFKTSVGKDGLEMLSYLRLAAYFKVGDL